MFGLSLAFPRADFGGHDHSNHNHADKVDKKCTLERSLAKTGPECFLEPECENKCEDVTRTVCNPFQENECNSFDVPSCKIVQEEKCETVYDTKLEEECCTKNVTVCNNVPRTECKVVLENKCETR